MTFLDAMLQMQVFASPGRQLRLPTRIRSLRIDPVRHEDFVKSLDDGIKGTGKSRAGLRLCGALGHRERRAKVFGWAKSHPSLPLPSLPFNFPSLFLSLPHPPRRCRPVNTAGVTGEAPYAPTAKSSVVQRSRKTLAQI